MKFSVNGMLNESPNAGAMRILACSGCDTLIKLPINFPMPRWTHPPELQPRMTYLLAPVLSKGTLRAHESATAVEVADMPPFPSRRTRRCG